MTRPCFVVFLTAILMMASPSPAQIGQPIVLTEQVADLEVQGGVSGVEDEGKKENSEDDKESVGSPSVAPQDVIEFLGGDRLHGKIVGMEPGSGVEWERADVKAPIYFSTANVSSIRLATLDRTNQSGGSSDTRVRLKDGSDFPAKLVSVEDATVKLDTWYGGVLDVKRSAVESIVIAREATGLLYEGPNSLEEWKQQNNREGWVFRNGGLVSSRSAWVGKEFEDLPEKVRIDFELQWAGQLALMVSLMPESLEQYSSGSYTIQLNSGYVYMYRNTENGNQNLGQTQVNELRMRNKVKVGIRLDRKAKSIALLINDMLVKQWKETGKWVAEGKGLLFYGQGQGPVRISDLEISGWDGSIREGEDGESSLEADLVTLSNGDKVSGKLVGIRNGEIAFSTSFAQDLKIPMERVSKIDFAREETERPTPGPRMVRGHFQGEGSLLFELKSLTREAADIATESFGEAILKPDAFKSLQFNLDQEKERDGDEDLFGFSEAILVE